MPIRIVQGDLCKAPEQYIAQQCCCTAVRPHGLSKTLALAFPGTCSYFKRKPIAPHRNLAVPEDRPTPGTIDVMGKIIHMYGQVGMGKPEVYFNGGVPDKAIDRQLYFKQCLSKIAEMAPKSVAMPFNIGCGLAGGDWKIYSKMLEEFAKANPGIELVLYNNQLEAKC